MAGARRQKLIYARVCVALTLPYAHGAHRDTTRTLARTRSRPHTLQSFVCTFAIMLNLITFCPTATAKEYLAGLTADTI